jgi:hypothetical protein
MHPFEEVQNRLTNTYQRIEHLDKTMDLTFGTFLEWQRLQCKELYDELYSQTPTKPTMVENDELETLFDSYAELPIDIEEFFDAQTIEAVENDSSWDF